MSHNTFIDVGNIIGERANEDILEKKLSEILAKKSDTLTETRGIGENTTKEKFEVEAQEIWAAMEELKQKQALREMESDRTNEVIEIYQEPEVKEALEKTHQEVTQEILGYQESLSVAKYPITQNEEYSHTTMQKNEEQAENESSKSEAVKQGNTKKKKERKKNTKGTFVLRLLALVGILGLTFAFAFGVMRVNGETMYPKVRNGDIVFYSKIVKNYNIGDVVVFQDNGFVSTARVVAKAGDAVEISDAGALIVNGKVQFEDIFYPTERIPGGVGYPYTVEENSFFLLGDNRTQSSDSRCTGAVKSTEIKGKVVILLRGGDI